MLRTTHHRAAPRTVASSCRFPLPVVERSAGSSICPPSGRTKVRTPGQTACAFNAAGPTGAAEEPIVRRLFTPGARTAWHSHPVGQTLFCLSGVGCICFKGEKPQVLNPGDTVNIPPDTMHWHGASPDRLFSHLALSEAGEQGQGTAWGAHVTDAEYNEPATGG